MKKTPFQNQYYVEIGPEEAEQRRPGTFYYGPVLYEPHIVATIRPVVTPGRRYATDASQHILFNVQLPLAQDAFLRKESLGSVIGPYEELVAVPGKMRPVIILSPSAANQERILALPSFKADNYTPADLQIIRSGNSLQHFYLPACGPIHVKEAVLEFSKLQAMRLDPKLTNPGQRKAGDTRHRLLRLADGYWAELQQILREFLSLE